MISTDPTAGTVLGEEVRNQLRALMFRGDPAFASDADEVLDRIEPVIAFLTSAAREAGRTDGRREAREYCGCMECEDAGLAEDIDKASQSDA